MIEVARGRIHGGCCEMLTNLSPCPMSALLFIGILVRPLFRGDGRIILRLILGKQVVGR